MRRRVTIMGGGNGALTAAAELSITGHDVTLFEMPAFAESVRQLRESGQISATGVIEGTGPLTVTHDASEAVAHAELIIIVVPTNFQINYAELLLPHLRDGMNIALMPGSLGSLEFSEYLRSHGCTADITVSEFAALPYACRIVAPGLVRVFGRRRYVSLGVFPAQRTDVVSPIANDLYPGIEILDSVLAAGLNNPNPTLHCLGVLLSASRIEYSRGDFYYYEEGLTPQVCKAVEAIDQERSNIGQALGVEVLSLRDTYYKMGYGPKGDTFWSVIRGVATLQVIKGPEQIDSRYLTEDVPIGLTIYSQLGSALGVDTSIMRSVITLAGALLEQDFVANGRTLERCGIAGLSKDTLLEYVHSGTRPV
ncbi:MAG: NAD/NADP octopine/nopaline dehydrogenase family protein [Actinomycetia bacterium]|nr:NAD/NADP octopine/nopaline dehydrogenase family protein [Actinomycetes bacterium]